MPDLADHTAATTASYRRVQIDRGAGANPRYVSLLTAIGESNSSQAAADTAALAALNSQRDDRLRKKSSQGGTRTVDVH